MSEFISEINALVNREVLIRSGSLIHKIDLQNMKDQYNSLVDAITRESEYANEWYEKMQADGLNYNTIEAEGYIRCIKRVLEIIEENNEAFSKE